MKIIRANTKDFEKIRFFYHSLIDGMKERKQTITWIKDVYPAADFLRSSLNNGELYMCCDGPRAAAVMVVNHDFKEGYCKLEKQTLLTNSEVLVIHALGVHPDYSGRGIGKKDGGRGHRNSKKVGGCRTASGCTQGKRSCRKALLEM